MRSSAVIHAQLLSAICRKVQFRNRKFQIRRLLHALTIPLPRLSREIGSAVRNRDRAWWIQVYVQHMHGIAALSRVPFRGSKCSLYEMLQPKGPDKKRQRVQKAQVDVPDSWIQKGMKVIDVLWSKKLSQIFRDPVKPSATFAPDYFQIIKHPMDLGTVRNKLRNAEYISVKDFEVVRILCV